MTSYTTGYNWIVRHRGARTGRQGVNNWAARQFQALRSLPKHGHKYVVSDSSEDHDSNNGQYNVH